MSVSEPQRLALHRAARAVLGEEEGDTLMALSPPANTDMATRQDVERAEERLGAKVEAISAKVDIVEERLGAKVEALDAKVDGSVKALRAEIGLCEARTRASVWKVVVGTGVGLYLALAATMYAGFRLFA